MNYKLLLVQNADVKGKRVFLRADLDVPLTQQSTNNNQQTTIEDDARLVAGMPTIQYLLEKGAKVIIGGHLGRPMPLNNELRIKNHELSLRPITEWLTKHSHNSLFVLHDSKLGDFDGWEIGENLFLLENLRFYEGEEKNPSTGSGQVFAKRLAKLADIYVNDAFAMCHRNHASIVGVPSLLPHYAGLRLQKETSVLSEILENPKRPLVVIIGGQKIETKLPLIGKMEKFADFALVGGKIAQEAKSQNHQWGSKVVVASSNQEGTDITAESLAQFLNVLKDARTIVWNGPMGRIGALLGNENFLVPHSQTARHANSENFVP